MMFMMMMVAFIITISFGMEAKCIFVLFWEEHCIALLGVGMLYRCIGIHTAGSAKQAIDYVLQYRLLYDE